MKTKDINTYFGFWPKRKVDVSIDGLRRIMDRHEVARFASLSLKGIFYDYEEGNVETLRAAGEDKRLIPAATVDLRKYYGGGGVARQCLEQGFKLIRLFPNLQGWPLNYAPFQRFMDEVAETEMPLMITLIIQPEGNHCLGMITEIARLTVRWRSPVIISSVDHFYYPEMLAVMETNRNIYLDSSLFNTPDSYQLFASRGHAGRIVFGSNSPLYYFASAALSLEKADISEEHKKVIRSKNITKLLRL
jgi:predicted TIM-barrel fold metal-dependent hydrolase